MIHQSLKYVFMSGIMVLLSGAMSTSYASDTATLRLDDGRITASVNQYGSRLDIDVQNSHSGPLACQIRVGNTNLSGLSCTRSIRAFSSQEVSIYVQLASSQGTLRYDPRRERFVARIDAGSTTDQPSTPSYRYRVDLRGSDTTPRVDQSLDLIIRSYENNSLDTTTRDRMRFEILRQSGRRYVQASSRDYSLDSRSYRMRYADRGSVRLRNYLKFHRTGNYKIRVTNTTRNRSDTITIRVRGSSDSGQDDQPSHASDNYYTALLSPALPKIRRSFDLLLQGFDRDGDELSSRDRVNIEVQRRLLPDSHFWTRLRTSRVCDLRQTSYRFAYRDDDSVNLENLVRCTRKGFYRIKITNRSNDKMTRYVYFTILDERDFTSRPVAGFTNRQKRAIQNEYKGFMNQVNKRENRYPDLASSTRRYNLRTSYYREINKITYNKDDTLVNYRAYQSLKTEFNRKMRRYR